MYWFIYINTNITISIWNIWNTLKVTDVCCKWFGESSKNSLFLLTSSIQNAAVKITCRVVWTTTSGYVITYNQFTCWNHQTKVTRGVQQKCIIADFVHGLYPRSDSKVCFPCQLNMVVIRRCDIQVSNIRYCVEGVLSVKWFEIVFSMSFKYGSGLTVFRLCSHLKVCYMHG